MNQIKVAKLVLKPARTTTTSNKIFSVNKPQSPKKREISPAKSIEKLPTALYSLRLNQNNRNKAIGDAHHEPLIKQHQQTAELEKESRKTEKERKTLSRQQPVTEVAPKHKSSTMDEATRRDAREYMKKQREKRKLEEKKEVDNTFIIKQRLNELRKTTRNVIVKKPTKGQSPVKILPTTDYYSMNYLHMKEIKVLRLKPMPVQNVAHESLNNNEVKALENSDVKNVQETSKPTSKPVTPVKKPLLKAASPVKKPASPVKKPASPLQTQNRQIPGRQEIVQNSTRPSSSKENKKPHDDFKLKVPDVKLSMSNLNKTEVVTSAHQSFSQPQQKVPFWLQNSAVQPYPYNFIWAVRKKLEAYTSADELKRKALEKSQALTNYATPHVRNVNRMKKGRKLPDFLSKPFGDDTKQDLQRPTIGDDSANSADHEEANTISGISSIKSDMALAKSQSQEKQGGDDDDDTTISESIFHSLKDDAFVGKKRESINSVFDRTSFEEKLVELAPSPNTTEKRINFLSSTKLSLKEKPEDEVMPLNDLGINKRNQEKEEEYQKMLIAFNQSLSHVIQVNERLSTVLSSKTASIASSSQTSGTVKNYSSSFENNIESDVHKTSGESNISEMIENLAQQSKPAPPPAEHKSDSNSSIQTFIEDSQSTTLKPEIDDAIEDPPINYSEPAQEFSSSTTKVTTTTTTTEIVQQKIVNDKKEDQENTLNESKLLNIFKYSESETSMNFTLADNNASFGLVSILRF